ELGRQHHALAPFTQHLAETFLRRAGIVGVGGVDQGDAGIDGGVHHAARRGAIEAAAEIVAAEPDRRDRETRISALPRLQRGSSGYCERGIPRICRASAGVAMSRPRRWAMPAMRSTSTALFLANSPGAIYGLSS